MNNWSSVVIEDITEERAEIRANIFNDFIGSGAPEERNVGMSLLRSWEVNNNAQSINIWLLCSG
jgi:hypothetical protein